MNVIILQDWYEQLKELDEQERNKIAWALIEYGNTGKEPELAGVYKALWTGFKKGIDRTAEKYEERVERNRRNGRKGGAPSKATSALFDRFWEAYPKKQHKQEARDIFAGLMSGKDAAEKQAIFDQILDGLEAQKNSDQWQEARFIPDPKGWLYNHRWEELPNNYGKSRTSSHSTAPSYSTEAYKARAKQPPQYKPKATREEPNSSTEGDQLSQYINSRYNNF